MDGMNREKAMEDLEVIRRVMEGCIQVQEREGIYFKIWGLLIPGAFIGNLVLVHFGRMYLAGFLWVAAMIAGIVASILGASRRKRVNHRSTGASLQKSIWLGSWISIAVVLTAGMTSRVVTISGSMMMIALVMGGSYFTSGTLSGSRMLRLAAVLWWVTGIITVFIPGEWAPYLVAAGTFFLSLIPGVILDRAYRKNSPGAADEA